MEEEDNIWVAASDGKIDLVKQLIESGKHDVNAKDENGYTPIHAAVSWGHEALLHYLLEKGADPNIGDLDGDTPLHVCEKPAIAEILLNAGATVDKTNDEGRTPADAAREDENMEMYEFYHQLGVVTAEQVEEFKRELEEPGAWEEISGEEGEEEEGESEIEEGEEGVGR
eukprot:comp19223_c0_seq1/m.21984 comp19223_c0_seq1/g.21984  ORF comp19223_c0_seq1/g.21984 comp19223_c0_seq1/m.21984 type:complete len:170 (-) comp19223_c0_seq1:676-1185(-)